MSIFDTYQKATRSRIDDDHSKKDLNIVLEDVELDIEMESIMGVDMETADTSDIDDDEDEEIDEALYGDDTEDDIDDDFDDLY